MTPKQVALRFAEAISKRDVDALYDLMTDDHTFIDGMGEQISGKERMRDGWRGYYTMVPDYAIEVTESFESGNIVAMLGEAFGTFTTDGNLKKENFWKVPAAWRAVIDGDKIRQWQVYADNEPIRIIMRREGVLE
ncbi:MAG: nuclear transport factor 2 family protein [Candidatus Zixiibacteriota bacterium]